jgi:hypothetical protein
VEALVVAKELSRMVWTRGRRAEVRRRGETERDREEQRRREEESEVQLLSSFILPWSPFCTRKKRLERELVLTIVLGTVEEVLDEILSCETHLLDGELLSERTRGSLCRFGSDDHDRDGGNRFGSLQERSESALVNPIHGRKSV